MPSSLATVIVGQRGAPSPRKLIEMSETSGLDNVGFIIDGERWLEL